MGAGKSTIGRRLSQILKMDFYDSDREIEHRTGADISLIFELEGEEGFRNRENAMIENLSPQKNIVLATGGGAILKQENRDLLTSHGKVVYLQTSVKQQLQRTSHDHKRPLLQTEDPEARLTELMNIRDPLYRETANIIVSTDGRNINTVAQEIIKQLGIKAP
jgi:shikimate kinase